MCAVAVAVVSAHPRGVVRVFVVGLSGTYPVSQPVFVNGDIYRINKLTTTDKALYRFYVAE